MDYESEKPLRRINLDQDDYQVNKIKNGCKGQKEYFAEYCNNTSLHGLKYVGGENRTIVEKLLWMIFFGLAVAGCSYLITKTYWKWVNTPVIVNFAQTPTPIWAIPFPAITICPQSKVKQSIFNFTQALINISQDNTTDMESLTFMRLKVMCDMLDKTMGEVMSIGEESEEENDESNTSTKSEDINFEDYFYDENEANDDSDADDSLLIDLLKTFMDHEQIAKVISEVAPNASDIFDSCIWQSETRECDELFTPVLTEDGLCYTFNALNNKDLYTEKAYLYDFLPSHDFESNGWDLESGYGENINYKASYPRRVLGAGLKTGLQVDIQENGTEFDYFCKQAINGFKVMVHQPGAIPKANTNHIRVPIDQVVNVGIQPNYLTTSDNLKNYDPQTRYCYFESERKLKFFNKYSQDNCELECLAYHTFKKCNCVSYYMPRVNGTPICSISNQKCVHEVQIKLREYSLKDASSLQEFRSPCNCMPACFSLQYGTEISQSDYNWRETLYRLRLLNELQDDDDDDVVVIDWDNYKNMHLTALRLYFKEDQFISTERNELYGVTDFLANCGGIFGLFTGFSILSLMEIIYYLTVRSFINKHILGRFYVATPENVEMSSF